MRAWYRSVGQGGVAWGLVEAGGGRGGWGYGMELGGWIWENEVRT